MRKKFKKNKNVTNCKHKKKSKLNVNEMFHNFKKESEIQKRRWIFKGVLIVPGIVDAREERHIGSGSWYRQDRKVDSGSLWKKERLQQGPAAVKQSRSRQPCNWTPPAKT